MYINAEEEMIETLCETVEAFQQQQPQQEQQPQQQEQPQQQQQGGARKFDLSNTEYASETKILLLRADKSDAMVEVLKREFPLPP